MIGTWPTIYAAYAFQTEKSWFFHGFSEGKRSCTSRWPMVGKRDYETMIKHGGLWSFKRELLKILDLDELYWAGPGLVHGKSQNNWNTGGTTNAYITMVIRHVRTDKWYLFIYSSTTYSSVICFLYCHLVPITCIIFYTNPSHNACGSPSDLSKLRNFLPPPREGPCRWDDTNPEATCGRSALGGCHASTTSNQTGINMETKIHTTFIVQVGVLLLKDSDSLSLSDFWLNFLKQKNIH